MEKMIPLSVPFCKDLNDNNEKPLPHDGSPLNINVFFIF